MENVHTIIKFDGPALDGHSMDVAHLAPALLALSDLVKAANQYANGDRAGVKIFVNANLEQKCFELNVQLVTTIWESAKLLIADDRVKTAKEIAEWIGIVAAPIVGASFGLFKFIKWIRGKKIETVTVIKVAEGQNIVEITVEGESKPIQINGSVYDLYADAITRRKALDVLAPLREEGYQTLQFYEDDDVFVEFIEDDVPLLDFSDLPEVIAQNVHTSTIRTGVKIRKAAYEGNSKWTLMYKRAINAAFDDEVWLERFQSGKVGAPPGSSLDVSLEETYVTNENDEMMGEPGYRVKKVHGVTLPEKQAVLEFKNDDS